MANSGLRGPWTLSDSNIDAQITKASAGAYALGRTKDGTYYISYVGRSDDDVNGRLKDHVGKYSQFKYEYYASPKAAFQKECELFHSFGETTLDNKVHPARPKGSDWKCPHCKAFG